MDDPPPQLPEVRPAPEQHVAGLSADSVTESLLARFDLAAVAQGGRRGGIGPDATTVFVLAPEPDELLRVLRDSGFGCLPLRRPDDVAGLDPLRSVLVVADGDDEPGRLLAEVNDAALRSLVPWLPVSAYDGTVTHVGPLLLPGETACFECLRQRLGAVPAYASLYDPVISGAAAVPTPRALRTWAYAVTALLLLRWLGHGDADLPGELFTLDPARLQVRRDRVFRLPHCPACAP